jgi:hypothetical protein
MLDQVYYWDNLLSQEEYSLLMVEFEKYQWQFDQGSIIDGTSPIGRTFWFKDFFKSEYSVNLFTEKIKEVLKADIKVQSLYGNGQAHGQCGDIHQDITYGPEIKGNWGTLVYFAHINWRPIYGGHLIVTDPDHTIVTNSFFPKTNSAVLFNSRWHHAGLEPTVHCKTQRLSIAFKFKVIENDN